MDEKTQAMLENLHLDLMQHKVVGNKKFIDIDYVLQEIEKIMLAQSEDANDENK